MIQLLEVQPLLQIPKYLNIYVNQSELILHDDGDSKSYFKSEIPVPSLSLLLPWKCLPVKLKIYYSALIKVAFILLAPSLLLWHKELKIIPLKNQREPH
jgi:hypothetical protein